LSCTAACCIRATKTFNTLDDPPVRIAGSLSRRYP